ncbi:UPF0587 protein C1orf123 homolog [Eurytemora carolleeae]|uniref:UPF0587 protein C1orf123 homolog n=1 Tax=Eurytemora carolleeae TaxID=1294199 RepID=UPI000C76FC62|nr:UPF0587 protein C1orf123 homolog [Eurytemora carolleeae]|eukprot:XP_023320746.1 UPF0587 protein C1orf123 homolog [Eurytemora affinis]
MVKIGLQIKAVLENVTGIEAEGEDFRWYLKLKCANCGEVPDHFQYITRSENQPLKGGRGEASCVIKCKLCTRENSIDIQEDSLASYNQEDNNKFKTIVVFDCRGMEPVEFSPRNGWKVCGYTEDEEGEGRLTGTEFSDVDLTELEWADYDEKSNQSTVISEFQSQFVTVKSK